jgi:hypothetical protein
VGLPLRPPPDWRPRAVPPPLPATPTAVVDPLWLILRAALVGLMLVVCMLVGWLAVQPARPRAKDEPKVSAAPAPPVAQPEEPPKPAPAVVKKAAEPPAAARKEVEPPRFLAPWQETHARWRIGNTCFS